MSNKFIFLGWHWWLLCMVTSTFAAGSQPHIVFIMLDDMGWNDVSFHGSDQIPTPNIDVLAYNGVILQNYYSEAICTPARTALLTGKYPMRLRMQGTPLFNSEDRGIPTEERLLPSYLKSLGYATHLVGKWHVGMSREEYLPLARGYDTHYGFMGGIIDYYTHDKVEPWPDGRILFGLDLFNNSIPQPNEDRYIVDALTERAVEIIQNHNTSVPLFLHMAHNAPHAGNTGGALQPPLRGAVGHNHIAESNRRLYAEIVSHVDSCIGKLITALAHKNILDNTIITFMSDNGAPTTGEYANWGVNLPFRGKKQTPWEGAVRVPAFIWHSSFKPIVWEGMMHITDWLPTLVAAAGGKISQPLDGFNQWDALKNNEESKRKEVLIAIEDVPNMSNYVAYRAGDYKIIIGNVTGISNGYYGSHLMANKGTPPDYFPVLRSCAVAQEFASMGKYLNREEIEVLRKATTIKQLDTIKDSIPCLPSPTRGCLFNIRKDPTESHDLWDRAFNITVLLTNRLRNLLAVAKRRGPLQLQIESDPANFEYIWKPWIYEISNVAATINNPVRENRNRSQIVYRKQPTNNKISTNCEAQTGFRNFLCIISNIFHRTL